MTGGIMRAFNDEELSAVEPTEDKDGGGKQVIARAAAVLRALEGQTAGLSLAQVAKATGLPRTTVHRIVSALEAQQMAISGVGGVRLGPALLRLAASAHTDVTIIARPFIEALGRATRETVNLSVFRGLHAISIDQYPSDQELRVISPIGTAFPIYTTAHGKAFLADMHDDAVRALLPAKPEQRTPSTIAEFDVLLANLKVGRADGYAVDIEEHARGVCGLGVVLQTGLNERYAVSLAVPALRFHEQRAALVAALVRCKAEIESSFIRDVS
jgi:DNA-binding IclR family transcriptional regulator